MPKEKDPNKAKAIHAAAMKLVIKTGFVGLKMADVAKEAGMATGTLYVYYKSKEELVNDIYIETKKEIVDILVSPNHKAETFYKTFRNMWMAYFAYCFKNPEKMMFVDQFLYSGFIEDKVYNHIDGLFEPLNQFLINAQQNGLVKQVDIELIKAQMEGTIHEVIKMLIRRNMHLGTEQLNKFFDMSWDSIRH